MFSLYYISWRGLGNHLFRIATAYAVARKTNQTPVFDLDYKTIRKYKNNILRNCINKKLVNYDEIFESKRFHFEDISCKVRDGRNYRLNGYFQSYKYFDEFKSEVQKLFEAHDDIKQYIGNKYPFIEDDNIAIHVRRGDYIKHRRVQDINYYNLAIDLIGRDKLLIVCSDGIEWCKENFKEKNIKFIEGERDYIDLYLMSFCKNNIISNSTFSWWSAYLNQNNGTVVMPKK